MPSSSISHLYTSLNVDTMSRAAAGAVAAKPLMMLYSWVMTPEILLAHVLYRYRMPRTLGLSDSLLALLDNIVGCVVGPADDDGAVGCACHDEGSEERNEEGEDGEAHYVLGDLGLRLRCRKTIKNSESVRRPFCRIKVLLDVARGLLVVLGVVCKCLGATGQVHVSNGWSRAEVQSASSPHMSHGSRSAGTLVTSMQPSHNSLQHRHCPVFVCFIHPDDSTTSRKCILSLEYDPVFMYIDLPPSSRLTASAIARGR